MKAFTTTDTLAAEQEKPMPMANSLRRFPRSFRKTTFLALLLTALSPALLQAKVQLYVTDYLAPQEKTIQPLGGKASHVARIFATPGEYEPVSLAVRPDQRVEQMFLKSGILPARRVPLTRPTCASNRSRDFREAPTIF